jgi:hypothetical protein
MVTKLFKTGTWNLGHASAILEGADDHLTHLEKEAFNSVPE